MTNIELPEGFKLLNRSRKYAISEKGHILHLDSGMIFVAPEGSDTITHRVESPGHLYEAEFNIPTLLAKHFGEQAGLSQKDFDELVSISGLSADACRERLNAGWCFETSTDKTNRWVRPESGPTN